MQYGLMTYNHTINLGNEIQSIAARRFLPKTDFYIDHERIHLFENPEKVKMIMNGWYLDCLDAWPPSRDIDPLLISMHFNTSVNSTADVIFSDESKDYFSTYGPVGCRDYPTMELLQQNGVDAYYSGCLTLTLKSCNPKNDNDYIVVNSHKSKKIIEYLKNKTDLPIYDIHQLTMRSFDKKYLSKPTLDDKYTSYYTVREKFLMAENLIRLYDGASCIITDRLHVAFPSLGLETPVLFINNAKFGLERLEGISRLVHETTLDEYMNDYDIFDVENPRENPREYLKIRKDLIEKTKKFTGHINEETFSYSSEKQLFENMLLVSRTCKDTRRYMERARKVSKIQSEKISDLQETIQLQEKRIHELESNTRRNPLKLFKKR